MIVAGEHSLYLYDVIAHPAQYIAEVLSQATL